MEARKDSTRKSYNSGMTLFWKLRAHLNWEACTPEAWLELVTLFIALLVHRGVAYGTVRVYVYGVRAWFMDDTYGGFDPCSSYRVQQCLTGARRILKDTPAPKLAFLFEFFAHIHSLMEDTFIDKRDWAMLLLSFFGLFRKSEVVAIFWGQIIDIAGGMKVLVAESKTDPFGKGMYVHIAERDDIYCPKKALREMAKFVPPAQLVPSTPVFLASPKSAGAKFTLLSKSAFVKRVKFWVEKIGLNPKDFAGHSLRRGGATALLRAGVPPDRIQLQGRWKSDAYRLYLQWSSDALLDITRAVAL